LKLIFVDIGFELRDTNKITHLLSSSNRLQAKLEHAEDADSCAHFLNHHVVDLILIDMRLVQQENFSFLTEKASRPPILLLVDPARESEALDPLPITFDDYLLKSELYEDSLARTVVHLVAYHRLHRSYRTTSESLEKNLRASVSIRQFVAQELRRNMATLLGHTKCLATELYGDRLQSVHAIEHQGERLLQEAKHLLNLWKLEIEPIELKLQAFDVGKVMVQVCEEVCRFTKPDAVRISYRLNQNSLKAYTDRDLLMTLLSLTLRFAIDHAESDFIEVGGRHENNSILIDFSFAHSPGAPAESQNGKTPITETVPVVSHWQDRMNHSLSMAQKIVRQLKGALNVTSLEPSYVTIRIRIPYL
jgi:K+-sensing histidine kinase KdpD